VVTMSYDSTSNFEITAKSAISFAQSYYKGLMVPVDEGLYVNAFEKENPFGGRTRCVVLLVAISSAVD
jgi:hypothetical protein